MWIIWLVDYSIVYCDFKGLYETLKFSDILCLAMIVLLLFRIPEQLAGARMSLMPLHSITASALFTSLLSAHNIKWGCLSEGIPYAFPSYFIWTVLLFNWSSSFHFSYQSQTSVLRSHFGKIVMAFFAFFVFFSFLGGGV